MIHKDITKPQSNGFKECDAQQLQVEFKEIFGVDFQHFYDPNGLTIDGKIWIDVVKFNEYLDDFYEGLREDKSMFDLILEEYGVNAVKLIEKLLPDKKLKLEKEFRWYLLNQSELVEKYNGRYLVIINEEVVGDYDTYEDAYFESEKKYELGTFCIQKCSQGLDDYTLDFRHKPYIKFI